MAAVVCATARRARFPLARRQSGVASTIKVRACKHAPPIVASHTANWIFPWLWHRMRSGADPSSLLLACDTSLQDFVEFEVELKRRKQQQTDAPPEPTQAADGSKGSGLASTGMSEFMELERRLLGTADAAEPPVARSASAQERRAAEAALEALQPPREPIPEECCGNDCHNCVWILYWTELQDYEREGKRLRAIIDAGSGEPA